MTNLKKLLAASKWLMPIAGLLITILGIILLFATSEGFASLGVFIGIAMIISGVIDFVSFYRKEKDKRTKTTLACGAIAVLLGLSVIGGRGIDIVNIILPIFFAVWLASISIPKIKIALAKRESGSPLWVIMFSFGILGIALGLLILLHSQLSAFVVTYALAFMFITHGISTIKIFLQINKEKEMV